MNRGDSEGQARELAYEVELKEQDRWLPIANGWSFWSFMHTRPIIQFLRSLFYDNVVQGKIAFYLLLTVVIPHQLLES